MTSNSIRVIIPGFGQPHIGKKYEIFNKNMITLIETLPINYKLDVHVYVYDSSLPPELPNYKNNSAFATVTAHLQPGIVGEFIAQNVHLLNQQSDEENFDYPTYVLMCLDDVELMPSFDLAAAIEIQKRCMIDVLSPTLTDESATFYGYMRSTYGPMYSQLPPGNNEHPQLIPLVRITSACEMFCYLMPTNSFLKWSIHLDTANPWLWGMDLLLTHKFGCRVGMIPFMTATHHYQSLCYDMHPEIQPFDRFHAYLAKYGETQESLSLLPAIVTTVPLV